MDAIDESLGEDHDGPRLFCYNLLIKTLTDNAHRASSRGQGDPGALIEHVDDIVLRMQRVNLTPNTRTYTGLLRSYVVGGEGRRDLVKERALQLLLEMEAKAFFPPTAVAASEAGAPAPGRPNERSTGQRCHILPIHVAFVIQACVLAQDLPLATSIYAEYCRHFGRQVRRRLGKAPLRLCSE